MSERNKTQRVLSIMGVTALGLGAVMSAGTAAYAAPQDYGNIDPDRTGSLTVHKFLHQDGDVEGDISAAPAEGDFSDPVADVVFTAYPLLEAGSPLDLTVPENWDGLSDLAPGAACTAPDGYTLGAPMELPATDAQGAATIDLAVGVYQVCETSAPANIVDRATPFILAVPMPYEDGWVYDVHAYPKNGEGVIEKTVEPQQDTGLGAVVRFPVTVPVPTMQQEWTGFAIRDTLDSRLEPIAAGDVEVTADGTALDPSFYEVTVDGQQVTLGGTDGIYGIPQDSGPMAMFYRSDLFAEHDIDVPTTWDEFKTAAKEIRELDGYITNFSTADINQFAGFVWQANGGWFANDGDEWTVDLTDDASTQVADYWQELLDEDLVATYPAWTDEWNNAYNKGEVWGWNSAVWGANTLISGAPDTAGNWSVAAAPQWSAGEASSGNWGGSSTAVFQGTEHLYEATKFALWLNTSEEALTELNERANLYPATTEGLELASLQEGVEFYGGQKIYDVFAEAAAQVNPDFVWGPTMTQTYADVSNGFQEAVTGQGSLLEALESAQSSTISTLKAQSIPVAE